MLAVVAAVVLVATTAPALAEELAPEEPEVVEPGEPPGATFKTILSYGLALLGLAMFLSVVAKTAAAHVKYPVTRLHLTNMLRTHPAQAEAMCRATPGTFLEALGGAIKAAAATGTRDPTTITATTAPTYDGTAIGVLARWKQALMRAKLGAMAVAGGFGVAASSGKFPIPIILIAVAVAGGAIWLLVFKHEVEAGIVRARREILPEVDRVFIDGRYQRSA